MFANSGDREIVAALVEKIGATQVAKQYKAGNLLHLDLSKRGLRQLPAEIWQLTSLERLNLSGNQLEDLPPEIEQLANLQVLDLSRNHLSQLSPNLGRLGALREFYLRDNWLSQLPPEIGQLMNLWRLSLSNNQFSSLPFGIGQLKKLQWLSIRNNLLEQLPFEIGQLTNLRRLGLINNRLTRLPPEIRYLAKLQRLELGNNQIGRLPPEIAELHSLRELLLNRNQLRQLAAEIGELLNLTELHLSGNSLVELPAEIGCLTNLVILRLDRNELSHLPAEIGQLVNLRELSLSNNQLSQLPAEIGKLTNLQTLGLNGNTLNQLPSELGQLAHLKTLGLNGNRLAQLPSAIGQLTSIEKLYVDGNAHLSSPPPEIVAQGTADILSFLRGLQQDSIIRSEAKLLIVGEGGTGKSSLLRALRGEEFDPFLSTTHGVEIGQLQLHPSREEITLNTWDFGGQQIYHATHQFFLSHRSLYLVIWNARVGVEQGRLPYWLETISALAPDAPVLLVATHTDERTPDLNYQLLKATYPQLAGNLSVSNKTGVGLTELQMELANQAAKLPLIGQPWPGKWLDAEHALMNRPEHHIDAATYVHACNANGVDETIARGTLGAYLHDLGKILYFRDDYVLCNLVVLKPNWITKAISLVLTDEAVKKADGILQHAELSRIWAVDQEGRPYGSHLYPIFLRLMERFDLSYQIESDVPDKQAKRSLVPQLLPYQPPVQLPPWPKAPPEGQTQVEMIYRFDFIPAGIMSWFIVRTHRFTKNLHWREGVLLTYQGHEARVELNPMSRDLRIVVWGVQPHNFFTILMNTIDIILSRFQGLVVHREIPCICHWYRPGAGPCRHLYSYEELVRRMAAQRDKVECAQTFTEVSVPMLLYGIHTSTDNQVMTNIRLGQQRIEKRLDDLQKLDIILEKLHQQSELIVRNFTRIWNLEMQKLEAECPNTFILTLGSSNHFNPKNWMSQEYVLHLLCQHPSGPHRVGDGYKLREVEEWWKKLNPWLSHVIKFLKFGIPIARPVGAMYDEVDVEHFKAQIDLMEAMTQQLAEATTLDSLNDAVIDPNLNREQQVIGPALRALYSFLSKADPGHIWGALFKTLTPDGNILWLCGTHREQYEVKPLSLGK